MTDWDETQQQAFLKMQFDAQHAHYMTTFPDAAFDVVTLGEEAVGRLYVDWRQDEIRIVDISLVPERRGLGIGSVLLRTIIDEAWRSSIPVRIHVERDNPALQLYRRLGFTPIDEQDVYWLMERSPDTLDESN